MKKGGAGIAGAVWRKKEEQQVILQQSKRVGGVSYLETLVGQGKMKISGGEREGRDRVDENIFRFQSEEDERQWLRSAFTGKLKEKFNWKDHEEELQEECAGSLKLMNMGNNQILIQSESEKRMD